MQAGSSATAAPLHPARRPCGPPARGDQMIRRTLVSIAATSILSAAPAFGAAPTAAEEPPAAAAPAAPQAPAGPAAPQATAAAVSAAAADKPSPAINKFKV